MNSKNRMGILIGVSVIFFVTLAIGVGVKTFWSNKTESGPQEKQQETEPARGVAKVKVNEKDKPSKGGEFTRWLIAGAAEAKAQTEKENVSQEEELETTAAEEEETAEEMEAEEVALEDRISKFANQGQSSAGAKNWRTVWADLNLTEEEKTRLRQGVMLLVQRWMAMPPEAQQAERARLQGMRVRFEAMSEEEKLEVSQRLRDRFEVWRMSGRIELPELTLD